MVLKITIKPHLSLSELRERFRQAKTPIEAHHYQIIWLIAQGKTTSEVSKITSYGQYRIRELVKGYNSKGPEFLGEHRVHNQDTDPLLNDIQLAQLWQVLQSPPGDGGLWNGRKVADWMSET